MMPDAKTYIRRLKEAIDEFVNYTDSLNECAYTDRMKENIIARARDLVFTEETRYDAGLSSIYAKILTQAAELENVKISKATIKSIIKEYGSNLLSFTINDYRLLVRERCKNKK